MSIAEHAAKQLHRPSSPSTSKSNNCGVPMTHPHSLERNRLRVCGAQSSRKMVLRLQSQYQQETVADAVLGEVSRTCLTTLSCMAAALPCAMPPYVSSYAVQYGLAKVLPCRLGRFRHLG